MRAATSRKRRAAGKKAAITRKRRTSMRSTAPATSTPAVVPMISYEDGIEEGPPGRRYRAEDLEGHRWLFFETDHV
jgi:hypothetical protein